MVKMAQIASESEEAYQRCNGRKSGYIMIHEGFFLTTWFLDFYFLFESMELFFLGQDFAIQLYLQPPVDVVTTANRKCAYMKHYGFSLLLGYLPPNMFK